jgi:methylated-DNA-[protein]-cysteine S-methyltransferase
VAVRARAQFTQYAVPGWGVGELWTGGGVLLTHEFRFGAAVENSDDAIGTTREPAPEAGPPLGAHGSLAGTVPTEPSRVGDGFVPGSQQRGGAAEATAGGTGTALDVRPTALDADELVERFAAFFAGREVAFDDVPLDLDWATPFQLEIAHALRAVPRGEVVSYGELAAIAGYPGAARAAGTFCAHNRFMLVVPCHRVVGASGLGGYGSAGIDTKRRLLALEGVAL